MFDTKKMFEDLSEVEKTETDIEMESLYDKVMEIKSPLDFTEDLATDDKIDEFKEWMMEKHSECDRSSEIYSAIERVSPNRSINVTFI